MDYACDASAMDLWDGTLTILGSYDGRTGWSTLSSEQQ